MDCLRHKIHIGFLHDISIAVFLENEIPKISAAVKRICRGALFQYARGIIWAHKLHAKRFIECANITVEALCAFKLEFFPSDISRIIKILKESTPMLGIGQIIPRLFLKKTAAMLAGAGIFLTEILHVIIHDAIDARIDHRFHIIKIDLTEIGVIIASRICAVAVARVLTRTAIDLHKGTKINALNLIIISQKLEDLFPVIIFRCSIGTRVKFTLKLFPAVFCQDPRRKRSAVMLYHTNAPFVASAHQFFKRAIIFLPIGIVCHAKMSQTKGHDYCDSRFSEFFDTFFKILIRIGKYFFIIDPKPTKTLFPRCEIHLLTNLIHH